MVDIYEKIQFILKPMYNSILGEEYSQRDFIVLSALLLMAVPLVVSSTIMGVFLVLGRHMEVNWAEVLVLSIIVGLGLMMVWFKKLTIARYLVVWSLFIFSLWGTWHHGFSFYGVLAYVVTMLMVYLVISRRKIALWLIVFLPPLVYRFFTPAEDYSQFNIWMYIGMMAVVGFLVGLLNYINEQARSNLVQIDELQAVQQAGVSVASSLDLQETTNRILEELQNILPHDSASVLLVRDGKEVELVACSGWKNPYDVIGIKFPIPGNNPNTFVIKEGRPRILTDAPKEYPSFLDDPHNHILSWLGVPLITRGGIIGMMAIDSNQEAYFSEEHIRVVTAFADHVAIAIENSRLFDLATQASNRRAILYRASQEVIKAGADLEYIYRSIHKAASEMMPVEAFVITLLDETEQFIDGAYLIDRGGRDKDIRIPLGEGMSGTVISTGQTILISDLLNEPGFDAEHFGHEDDVRSVVAVPFSIGNKVIGMLSAQSYDPNVYGQEELELLQQLAAQAGSAIQNARLLNRMEHLANTDSMTHLSNRRAFDTTLQEEINRAERYGYSLALMIMDIDDFKQFNDRYGHSRGDVHLRQIGSLIQNAVRESDFVARIGGEEFSVILPHTSCSGARELAERVRKNIETTFKDNFPVGGTVSIGIAEFPRDGSSPGTLFDAADNIMFRVKRSGKNGVGSTMDQELG